MTGPRDERRLQAAARELYDAAEGNPRRLAMIAAQLREAAAEARDHGPLWVVGGVSATTGKPYVQVEWGPMRGQIDVEAARGFATNLLESCANAVAEAALIEWARVELELDLDRAAGMIDALRRYRRDRWGQPDLELELEQPPPDEAAE
jgi:hypothetical protein